MTKHTEGPWHFAPFIGLSANGNTTLNLTEGSVEGNANRALIASAPDLLEASRVAAKVLNELLGGKFSKRPSADGALEILQDAIAKAEGRA